MKQLMEHLGLDIPKWEGPTVCESSAAAPEGDADMKPTHALGVDVKVKGELVKEEKKRAADGDAIKEQTLKVKKERKDPPLGIKDDK